MSACFVLAGTDARWEHSGEQQWKETALNLEQALAAGDDHLAYRVVDDLRVIVDCQGELLVLQIQRRSKKRHWLLDEEGGQVRYLEGIFHDGPGRYLCILRNLACLVHLEAYLPLRYQALLLPERNDWYPMKRDEG